MNDKNETEPVSLTRDQLRAKIFAADNKKGKSKVVNFFGTEIEVRQPTVGQVTDYTKDGKENISLITMLINHTFVPGTNDRVFEESDADGLKELPFTEDMRTITDVVAEFATLENDMVSSAEKN